MATEKPSIAPPKDVTEIANKRVYGTHLRMLLKRDIRVQMDVKFGKLKNESKSELFSAPGDALQDPHKVLQKGATEVPLKVALQVAFQLHLLM